MVMTSGLQITRMKMLKMPAGGISSIQQVLNLETTSRKKEECHTADIKYVSRDP